MKTKTKAVKSTKAKSVKSAKAAKSVKMPAADTTFRVVRLPLAIRDAVRAARLNHTGQNNQSVVADAVSAKLPLIVADLKALGCGSLAEKQKAFRLPFSDSTLADLKLAGEATGLPAAHLLVLCLSSLAVAPAPAVKVAKVRKSGKAVR